MVQMLRLIPIHSCTHQIHQKLTKKGGCLQQRLVIGVIVAAAVAGATVVLPVRRISGRDIATMIFAHPVRTVRTRRGFFVRCPQRCVIPPSSGGGGSLNCRCCCCNFCSFRSCSCCSCCSKTMELLHHLGHSLLLLFLRLRDVQFHIFTRHCCRLVIYPV